MSTNKNPIDEQEEKRLFTPRSFTFDEYLTALTKREKELAKKSPKDWSRYNVTVHSDPYSVQIEVLYSMLRHIMWKLSNCEYDIDEMAFAQRGFEAAQVEAENNYWRLAADPSEEVTAEEEKLDAFELLEKLHRGAQTEQTRTIRQTIKIDRS